LPFVKQYKVREARLKDWAKQGFCLVSGAIFDVLFKFFKKMHSLIFNGVVCNRSNHVAPSVSTVWSVGLQLYVL